MVNLFSSLSKESLVILHSPKRLKKKCQVFRMASPLGLWVSSGIQQEWEISPKLIPPKLNYQREA